MKNIKLKNDESAMVVSANGIELHLKKYEDETIVDDCDLILSTIAILWEQADEDFLNFINDKFEEIRNKFEFNS